MNAKISIVVPVYKVEKYIYRCIDSILAQTYANYELILVDDGSPDKCGEICDEYSKKDVRIHVIHQKNAGLSAARNAGIEWINRNSSSEYITFIDSDDWIHSQYLELLLYALETQRVNVSICCHERVDEYKEDTYAVSKDMTRIKTMSAEDLLVYDSWNFNYAWGKLYKRELFRNLRYPVGKNYEDTFTTYKTLFTHSQVAVVQHGLYYYYRNPNGITRSLWNPSELIVFEGMQEQMKFYKENGYTKAYEKEEALYVNHFAYQITRIRANKADLKTNQKYIKLLKKQMLYYMKSDKKKYGYRSMPQCYEAAYPRFMNVYKKCSLIYHKLFDKK